MIITENKIQLQKYRHTDTGEDVFTVEGYACHFNQANLNREIVDENSFKRFFEVLNERHIMPIFDYDHTGKVIGAWDSITSDENGLYVKGHIYKNIAFVRDELAPLIENGDLSYLSTMGFASGIEDRGNSYYVGNFELLAISLVEIPADMTAYVEISSNGAKIERHEYQPKPDKPQPKLITNNLILFI